MKKHTIPVHLETQDKLLYGLTTKQVMVIAIGLTAAYSVWSSVSPFTGLIVSLIIAALPVVLAFLVAFFQPAGTDLDEWAMIQMFYLFSPKVYLWDTLLDENSDVEDGVEQGNEDEAIQAMEDD